MTVTIEDPRTGTGGDWPEPEGTSQAEADSRLCFPFPCKQRVLRLKLSLLGAIILLAAFFRLYRLSTLPPGDGYDPAYYGVDALQILQGARPIFLPSNFGREVLFSYLVAACMALLGPTSLAIHFASAVIGILTIPALYLFAEELFREEEEPLRSWGALLAAFTLAISYWHLNWSRYGARVILVPLFACLTGYFLWRVLRRPSRHNAIFCGIMLGLSLYTYQAARLLPGLVVIGFVYQALGSPNIEKREVKILTTPSLSHFLASPRLCSLALIILTSLLVFAPLGYYFVTHPGSFIERIDQTFVLSMQQDPAAQRQAMWRQIQDGLLLFSFRGDTEPYSTIPERPALDVFTSVLFYGGFVISLIFLVLRRRNISRQAFMLTWFILMLLPGMLAGQGPVGKRAIGALPIVVILIAQGTLGGWQALRRWLARGTANCYKIVRAGYASLMVGGFLYSGAVTYRDYFVLWANDPNLFVHFEVGVSKIGDYIRMLPPDEYIYLSPDLPDHPGIRLHSQLREGVRGYNGRVCLVTPVQTSAPTTYIIVPGKDRDGISRLHALYPQGNVVYEGPRHYGDPYFLAYQVPAHSTAEIAPGHSVDVQWAEPLQLLGYDTGEANPQSPHYQPGDTVSLRLYFQANGPIQMAYTVFLHLTGETVNPQSGTTLWAQDDSQPCRGFYPTTVWDTGEIIIDTFTLTLPPDTPAGDYTLKIGAYNWTTMERLPVLIGEAQDNIVTLGTISVK
ncbi:MAG: glycosyltransferase family 39 protein [Anaerolineae bacterium]|nr:glycosyltransferase family 39 protein [Anaerolineae bacterium]